MKMKKKRIVYSLTGRGLFSELSNLALALVYADYNQEELTVNTRNWNARVEKGWSDYFESVLPNCNGVMCSQYIVYKKGKPWWGNIYYNPSAFFRYYIFYIMNRIYLLFHPETELGNEVFLKMRSEDFLEKLEDIRNDYGSALRKILKFNEKTTDYIEKRKSEMNLPVDYIAVHIRRGDKIVSREMKELGLFLYIDAVKGKKHISRNVFIATDDGSVTDKLKSVLVAEGFNVYWNTAVTQTGFDESLFNTKDKKSRMISDGKKPFRQYAGICASGQSVKTTLIRLYSIILQTALDIAKDPEYEDYIDPYYTLIGYFNSIRELGGAVRLLDDDIASRIRVVKNKYNSSEQRYLSFEGKKEITSRIPSWEIAQVLEKLAISYDKNKEKQGCYDVVIATNMIAVGMDVDRLGLMSVKLES